MKSEESDDYINFTDFITLNLIGIRVPLYACVCVCVYVCKKCISRIYRVKYHKECMNRFPVSYTHLTLPTILLV